MSKYGELIALQRAFVKAGGTRSLETRRATLAQMKKFLNENSDGFAAAYKKDLGRGAEALQFELTRCCEAIDKVSNSLESWMKSTELPIGPPLEANDRLLLVKEPLGVVLNIVPWNGPLVSFASNSYILAAGNTVVYKPSELAPTFADLFERQVPKYFEQNVLAVVNGGIPETTALLKERFDHILYTGSTGVAKIVMEAASKHLTPVTLELGGKNPVYIDDTADIPRCVQSLIFAKSFGAGQACVCPDYLLATKGAKAKLIAELQKALPALGDMSGNGLMGRIVNQRHFDRIHGVMQQSKGKVVAKAGGENNRETFFLPIQVWDVPRNDSLMEEEIFGPVYPITEVAGPDDALEHILKREKPLAAYCFTNDAKVAERFVKSTSSGGVTVNDVFSHCITEYAPFGGVGHSGMGRLMGKYGFDTFTHEKPVAVRHGLPCDLNSL